MKTMIEEKAEYLVIPEASCYSETTRYEKPKENFKFVVNKLKEFVDPSKEFKAVDLGCANGEFLYLLRKEFPHWHLSGIDQTETFIDVARNFSGLQGVDFYCGNFLEMDQEAYDFVFCMGTIPIFEDVSVPLLKLMDLCKTGAFIFADGLFNPYDVEVRVQFCDNSVPEAKGFWRKDFNYHSQRSIYELLEGQIAQFSFDEIPMDVEIPYSSETPDVRVFTFKDSNGKNIITSGLNLILNPTLLTIQK